MHFGLARPCGDSSVLSPPPRMRGGTTTIRLTTQHMQKHSNMLAKMRQLCPAGEDKTALFRWMFLRRLPDKVKLMLAEDHSSSVTVLAARADILTASAPKPVATVAAAAKEEAVITAAVAQPNRGRRRGNFQRGSYPWGGSSTGRGSVLRTSQTTNPTLPPATAYGRRQASATTTGHLARCHTSAGNRASGRKTNNPSPAQRCRRRSAGTHNRPANR